MLHIYTMLSSMLETRRQEKGATATEYALIIAFIVLVLVGAMTLFGEAIEDMWNNLTDSLPTAP